MLLWEISQQVFYCVVVSTLHLEKSGELRPPQPSRLYRPSNLITACTRHALARFVTNDDFWCNLSGKKRPEQCGQGYRECRKLKFLA